MKKAIVYLFILLAIQPFYAMDVMSLLQGAASACNPSANENQRGLIGSALRKLQKEWGALDLDLAGLGSELEKNRTLTIFSDLSKNIGCAATQKQYGERQMIVSRFACDLIAQLEEFSSRCKDKSHTINMVDESPGVFKLIKISTALRELHHKASLAPIHNIRLIHATNSARSHIKKRLQVSDRKHSSEQSLLTLEPEADSETIDRVFKAVSRKTIMRYAINLLHESVNAMQHNERNSTQIAIPFYDPELIQLAAQLIPSQDLLHLAKQRVESRGAQLKIIKPAPASQDTPKE